MIYCGPVPVPTLEKFWFRLRFSYRIQTYLAQFFDNKKFVHNLVFSMLEAALFPRSWPLIFYFFTFVLYFMLDPGPNQVPEPDPEWKCITVRFRLRQVTKLRFLLHNTAYNVPVLYKSVKMFTSKIWREKIPRTTKVKFLQAYACWNTY